MRFGQKRADPDRAPDFCPDFLIETYLDHQVCKQVKVFTRCGVTFDLYRGRSFVKAMIQTHFSISQKYVHKTFRFFSLAKF